VNTPDISASDDDTADTEGLHCSPLVFAVRFACRIHASPPQLPNRRCRSEEDEEESFSGRQ
jgi:hypothetical protein